MTNHTDDQLGALIRLVADDEATPAQRADFDALREALSPAQRRDLDALVEAERSLRAATARALRAATPGAPHDLRDRVLASVADAEAPKPLLPRLVRANWAYAAAAAILLALVAGMLVLSAASWRGTHWTEAEGPSATLVNFLSNEHARCSAADSKYASRKLQVRTEADALNLIRRYSPADPDRVLRAAAAAGYRFSAGGPCHVPGGGTSIHLVFVAAADADDEACAPVSVFLQDCSARGPESLPAGPVSLGHCPAGSALRMARLGGDGCLIYIAAPSDDVADAIVARLAGR